MVLCFQEEKIKFKPNPNLFLISHFHKNFNPGSAVKVVFTCPSRILCHNRHISRVSASPVQIFPMAWSLFHTGLLLWFFMAGLLTHKAKAPSTEECVQLELYVSIFSASAEAGSRGAESALCAVLVLINGF